MAEVRLEVDLAHSPERVWSALTDARLLEKWFLRADASPSQGGQVTFHPDGTPGFLGPISAEVTELAEPRRLAMRWHGEQLDARVAWELVETPGGCQVRVVQSGFVGSPVTPRQRNLRATYIRQFGERLPALLAQMAAAGGDAPAGGESGDAPAGDESGDALAGGESGDAPVAGMVEAPHPPPGQGPPPARERPAAPVWLRASVVGATVAVLVAVLLAGLTGTWLSRPDPASPDGPEVADGANPPVPAGPPPAAPLPAPGQEQGPTDAGQAGDAATTPARPPATSGPVATAAATVGRPGSTSTPIEGAGPADNAGQAAGAGAPELTAVMTTSGRLLGLSGRSVTVTISNPGPGYAETWVVTMDVGDQQVTGVSGADHTQDGSIVTFTPSDGGLAAGESTQFRFDLPGPLLGLGGASDPTDCMIDGRPCQ